MKIGMMCAWNSDSGASVHAELIGRSWVELGHEVRIFSFYKHDFHGTQIVGEDEDYVVRCFTTSKASPPKLDPVPILTADYDVFVVQDLGMLPKDALGKIFGYVRKKPRPFTLFTMVSCRKIPLSINSSGMLWCALMRGTRRS
jgi:hypothetical protein